MGKPYAPFDVAGAGDGFTVGLVRHSQRKRGATARLDLRSTAPALDPTGGGSLETCIARRQAPTQPSSQASRSPSGKRSIMALSTNITWNVAGFFDRGPVPVS